ncbi:hypothetical protein [Streptomyces sp. NPDC054961]
MREPVRTCFHLTPTGCVAWWPSPAKRASAVDDGGPRFDYVGAVSSGTVSDRDNQEEAFPGQNIDQLRQHLVGDQRTYQPNVVQLQLDVANDLASDTTLTAAQEAERLRVLLEQIHYVLPRTMVLVGDPAPSKTPAIRDRMYSGDSSYLARSIAVINDARSAGHHIRQVPIAFPHDVSFVDTTQDADGVPNDKGYQAMAQAYVTELRSLWQSGAVVAPDEVVVNPADLVVDASGVDDDPSSGEGTPTTNPPLKVMVVGTPTCADTYLR